MAAPRPIRIYGYSNDTCRKKKWKKNASSRVSSRLQCCLSSSCLFLAGSRARSVLGTGTLNIKLRDRDVPTVYLLVVLPITIPRHPGFMTSSKIVHSFVDFDKRALSTIRFPSDCILLLTDSLDPNPLLFLPFLSFLPSWTSLDALPKRFIIPKGYQVRRILNEILRENSSLPFIFN